MVSGFLAKDSEINTIPNGSRVLKAVLASNEFGDEKNTDGTNKALWINVSSFEERTIRLSQYLKKGSSVIVIGDMKPKVYQTKNGEWQCGIEINNADISFNSNGKKDDDNTTGDTPTKTSTKTSTKPTDMTIPVQPSSTVAPSTDETDDLPF